MKRTYETIAQEVELDVYYHIDNDSYGATAVNIDRIMLGPVDVSAAFSEAEIADMREHIYASNS